MITSNLQANPTPIHFKSNTKKVSQFRRICDVKYSMINSFLKLHVVLNMERGTFRNIAFLSKWFSTAKTT